MRIPEEILRPSMRTEQKFEVLLRYLNDLQKTVLKLEREINQAKEVKSNADHAQ